MKNNPLNIFKKFTKKSQTESKLSETRNLGTFENETWEEFLAHLNRDILPLYINHEKSFDHHSIHGRMHICRALIFSEVMTRYYLQETVMNPSVSAIRYAVAFHDSGRQGNGFDIWEADSAQNCINYLSQFIPEEKAKDAGFLIEKKGRWGLDKRIMHDADVLEIMRPCCGHGGIDGFRKKALRFLGARDQKEWRDAEIRNGFIEEAWYLIRETERLKGTIRNVKDYMGELLEFVERNEQELPFISKYMMDDVY